MHAITNSEGILAMLPLQKGGSLTRAGHTLLTRRGSREPTFPGSLHGERYSHLLLQAHKDRLQVTLQEGRRQGRVSQVSVSHPCGISVSSVESKNSVQACYCP